MTATTDQQNETTIARLGRLIYKAEHTLRGLNSLARVVEMTKGDGDTHSRYCRAIDHHLEDMQEAAEKVCGDAHAAIDAANAVGKRRRQ